ncbi:hypothetical protein BU103_10945 [Staphylococcus xylosus]|uniref:hypothetical protein n=1 Tax=Staphylococcus pseudoxylosus TaxID=2282419 RepID=UPI000D1F30E8|nr:hypothetical protein [Staphylococcus pseudoxylosus]PTI57021.1 hypothetical protein BU103_10945 [Staphylococcus xylosus]
MNLSYRKKEALNKLNNEDIYINISPKYINKSSDEKVEKMAETFIDFFRKIDEQNKEENDGY